MREDDAKPADAGGDAVAFDRMQLIKLAVEFGPLIVFFVGNSKFDIFVGTGAFMVATVVALIVSRAVLGRIPTMPLISGAFVVVFGGLTLWLQDDAFIKLKPTIVNALFATILLGGLAAGQSFLKFIFEDVMRLTDEGWRKLTFRWGLFFVFLALLNEVIWRNFSTDFWVGFKVFGIMPITFAFALAQFGLIKRYEAASK